MSVSNYKYLLFFLLILIFLSAESRLLFSQKFIALDIYRITGFKRIRYYEKDEISFRLKGEQKFRHEKIISLNDSSFQTTTNEIAIGTIDVIRIDKSNSVTRGISGLIFWYGAMHMALNTINNAINDDAPILDKEVIAFGSSLMLFGWATGKLLVKRLKIGKRKMLKVIDVTP